MGNILHKSKGWSLTLAAGFVLVLLPVFAMLPAPQAQALGSQGGTATWYDPRTLIYKDVHGWKVRMTEDDHYVTDYAQGKLGTNDFGLADDGHCTNQGQSNGKCTSGYTYFMGQTYDQYKDPNNPLGDFSGDLDVCYGHVGNDSSKTAVNILAIKTSDLNKDPKSGITASVNVQTFQQLHTCSLTNYQSVSVLNARPSGAAKGTGTWTAENPAQMSVDFTSDTYSQKGEVFNQDSISGNTMVMKGSKQASSNCALDEVDVGDAVYDYLNATTATLTYEKYEYAGGGSNLECTQHTVPIAMKNAQSYKDAGGKAVPGNNQDTCPIDSGTSGPLSAAGLRWFVCPILNNTLIPLVESVTNLVGSLLATPVGIIFTPAMEQASAVVRNLAIALLIISGLLMVISEASGLDIFAAYTVRKALPRTAIATIGIALAWPLMQFVVILFNDLGFWVGNIIMSTVNVHSGDWNSLQNVIFGTTVTSLIAVVYTGVTLFSLSWGGFGLLLVSIALVVIAALLVLALRQIIILLCVLLAPLAIAASVLPGTERLWKFWRETFIRTLLMFPLLMALIAAGSAMANLTASIPGSHPVLGILAVVEEFAGLAMIPFGFQLAGGVMSTAYSALNGFRTRTVEAGLRNLRQQDRQRVHNLRMQGRTGLSSTRLGFAYRSLFSPEAGGVGGLLTRGGRNRLREYDVKRLNLAAAENATKGAGGFGTGNDRANEFAVRHGQTREGFINDYANSLMEMRNGALVNEGDLRNKAALQLMRDGMDQRTAWARASAMTNAELGAVARNDATNTADLLQTSYQAEWGSTQMRLTAWKALMNSTTSYRTTGIGGTGDMDSNAGTRRLYEEAGQLIQDGVISSAQAAVDTKYSQAAAARREQRGEGYYATVGAMERAAAQGGMTVDQARTLMAHSLYGNDPGEFLRGRPETIGAFAPILVDNIRDNLDQNLRAQQDLEVARRTGSARGIQVAEQRVLNTQQAYEDSLAQVSAWYTYLQGVSQEKADIFAHNVNSRVVGVVRDPASGRLRAEVVPAAPRPNPAAHNTNTPQQTAAANPAVLPAGIAPDSDDGKFYGQITVLDRIKLAKSHRFFEEKERNFYNQAVTPGQTAATAAGGVPPTPGGIPTPFGP